MRTPESYIKTYEGEAYDGRKYYISYVIIEEVPYSEEFSKWLTGAACPIIPGVKAAYSHDWLAFCQKFHSATFQTPTVMP